MLASRHTWPCPWEPGTVCHPSVHGNPFLGCSTQAQRSLGDKSAYSLFSLFWRGKRVFPSLPPSFCLSPSLPSFTVLSVIAPWDGAHWGPLKVPPHAVTITPRTICWLMGDFHWSLSTACVCACVLCECYSVMGYFRGWHQKFGAPSPPFQPKLGFKKIL